VKNAKHQDQLNAHIQNISPMQEFKTFCQCIISTACFAAYCRQNLPSSLKDIPSISDGAENLALCFLLCFFFGGRGEGRALASMDLIK